MSKLKIFVGVLFLTNSIPVFSNKDSTKIQSNYFIDISVGAGQFLLGKPLSEETEKLSGNFNFSTPVVAGVSFAKNFSPSSSSKWYSKSFLSVGGGIGFMSYGVDHTFTDHAYNSAAAHKYYEFSQHQCTYRVNTLNYSLFFSKTTLFASDFFIRNKFGLSLATYVNKATINYRVHVTGSGYEQDPSFSSISNPAGVYSTNYDYYKVVTEKNYEKINYSAFYSLSFGTKFKNIIYYASPEILFLKNDLSCVLKYQVGMIIQL